MREKRSGNDRRKGLFTGTHTRARASPARSSPLRRPLALSSLFARRPGFSSEALSPTSERCRPEAGIVANELQRVLAIPSELEILCH